MPKDAAASRAAPRRPPDERRPTSAARRALADELKGRIELDNPVGLVTATSLVNEAVETYLKNRMDDARNGVGRANTRSVKICRSVAENWIKPILGELQVRHLTPGRLDTYFRNDVPPTRYADVRKIIHAFIKWLLVRTGHVQAVRFVDTRRQPWPRARGPRPMLGT